MERGGGRRGRAASASPRRAFDHRARASVGVGQTAADGLAPPAVRARHPGGHMAVLGRRTTAAGGDQDGRPTPHAGALVGHRPAAERVAALHVYTVHGISVGVYFLERWSAGGQQAIHFPRVVAPRAICRRVAVAAGGNVRTPRRSSRCKRGCGSHRGSPVFGAPTARYVNQPARAPQPGCPCHAQTDSTPPPAARYLWHSYGHPYRGGEPGS